MWKKDCHHIYLLIHCDKILLHSFECLFSSILSPIFSGSFPFFGAAFQMCLHLKSYRKSLRQRSFKKLNKKLDPKSKLLCVCMPLKNYPNCKLNVIAKMRWKMGRDTISQFQMFQFSLIIQFNGVRRLSVERQNVICLDYGYQFRPFNI